MEGPNKSQETPQEIFLKSLGLNAGKSIALTKKGILTKSEVPVGASFEGVLDEDVKIGQPIFLNGKSQVISNIEDIATQDGKIFFKTSSSVYELILEPKNTPKVLTKKEYEGELKIFDQKGYQEWDMLNNRVPFDDQPATQLMLNAGLTEGDQVVYFSDGKERRGLLSKNPRGEFCIKDEKGNNNGIFSILNEQGSFIKKA